MRLLLPYAQLLKVRLSAMIALAALGGLEAVGTRVGGAKALALALAVFFASAGAGALNHYFERDVDPLMSRTARRPLVGGRITPRRAFFLGIGFIFLGVSLGVTALHPLVGLHIFLGAFVYLVVYTVWLKRRTWLNVVVGGLAGSFAVLAGGAAARPEWCLPPVILAAALFFWSPAHFWGLAMAYEDDYRRAGIPMLPVVKGREETARAVVLNGLLVAVLALLAAVPGKLGWLYLGGALLSGGLFLLYALRLLRAPDDRRRAIAVYRASMIQLGILFLGLFLDRYFLP